MWEPENYKLWISPFGEGSHYKTDQFSKGAKIHFLTPQGEGMNCNILEIEKHKKVVFEYMSAIKSFKEIPFDPEYDWTGARESYSLQKIQNGIKLTIQIDTDPIHIDFMNSTFPKAMQLLKQLSE